ncbi:hypothetical protein ACJJTC_016576 [Scirpophaga incertulas]
MLLTTYYLRALCDDNTNYKEAEMCAAGVVSGGERVDVSQPRSFRVARRCPPKTPPPVPSELSPYGLSSLSGQIKVCPVVELYSWAVSSRRAGCSGRSVAVYDTQSRCPQWAHGRSTP